VSSSNIPYSFGLSLDILFLCLSLLFLCSYSFGFITIDLLFFAYRDYSFAYRDYSFGLLPSYSGALMKFDVSNNELRADGGNALAAGLKGNQVITELSIASNWLSYNSRGDVDISGVNAIADVISDMGSLSSLHVGCNCIPEKEMRKIMAIAASKESMKILCEVPFKDKTITALDVSGKKLGVEGALVVAEYLNGNETMAALDISMNKLTIGPLKAGKNGDYVSHYETVLTGTTKRCVLTFSLLPLTRTFLCRHYRHCRCHQGYGSAVGVVFEKQRSWSQRSRRSAWCNAENQLSAEGA
jgi:hypothetical protein